MFSLRGLNVTWKSRLVMKRITFVAQLDVLNFQTQSTNFVPILCSVFLSPFNPVDHPANFYASTLNLLDRRVHQTLIILCSIENHHKKLIHFSTLFFFSVLFSRDDRRFFWARFILPFIRVFFLGDFLWLSSKKTELWVVVRRFKPFSMIDFSSSSALSTVNADNPKLFFVASKALCWLRHTQQFDFNFCFKSMV